MPRSGRTSSFDTSSLERASDRSQSMVNRPGFSGDSDGYPHSPGNPVRFTPPFQGFQPTDPTFLRSLVQLLDRSVTCRFSAQPALSIRTGCGDLFGPISSLADRSETAQLAHETTGNRPIPADSGLRTSINVTQGLRRQLRARRTPGTHRTADVRTVLGIRDSECCFVAVVQQVFVDRRGWYPVPGPAKEGCERCWHHENEVDFKAPDVGADPVSHRDGR